MFRTTVVYKLVGHHTSTQGSSSFAEFESALKKKTFVRPQSLEHESEGFIPPFASSDQFAADVDGHWFFALKKEEKQIPPSEVNERLQQRVEKIEQEESRKVGKKEKLALKEQVLDEILPNALSRFSVVQGFVDIKRGWIVLAAPSRNRAEGILSRIRESFTDWRTLLVRTAQAPSSAMGDWLLDTPPAEFELGDEAELANPGENGAVAKLKRQELQAEEVRKHQESGKQVVKLRLVYRERLMFTLTDDLHLKVIKYLDGFSESVMVTAVAAENSYEAESGQALVMAAELVQVWEALLMALGGEVE
ncbi:recombination-associated protein RdgC [Chromobacterium vaccinii]|uniref:recombination-associated protein RdgC n=1 Tax=Chromobacterium vaccinii TaxID=1108595 RepID=UPI003C781CF7